MGDTVAYSRRFLQSISCFTGDMPQARGKVTGLKELGKEIVLVPAPFESRSWNGHFRKPRRAVFRTLYGAAGALLPGQFELARTASR